ncbi:MAG: thiamine pyrophosphate-binding protein [Paludibacter sp.]|nr:thiamine pyrophosphate-binding protein [Paludibacter sp.]
MKLSDYIVNYFEKQGVRVVFGYIGGMITHLVDSIALNENVHFVQTYHEQTAAIAAEGYAKESGTFGVAIATSGPGATNMMTGIADAYFDSIPVIYITGQVNTFEYKYDKPIRQQGFQETDVVSMVKPVTKYAALVDKAIDIRYELEKATYFAMTGRRGPVLLDIPMDIQRTEINPDELRGFTPDVVESAKIDYKIIAKMISDAQRPMILVGAGCLSESSKNEINQFLSKTKTPILSSLLGRGVIDETYPNYLGMIGSYGNRNANMGIANADLLIALGTRLDTRQTGAMVEKFIEHGKIIHVDIDNNELENHRLTNRIKVHSDVSTFMKKLNTLNIKLTYEEEWISYLLKLKDSYKQDKEIERFVENKAPYRFMQLLNNYSKENDVFCVDIGQNQMWAAQTLQLKKGQKFVTSGGLAPMGFSMPVAIGTAFANPEKNIFSINGDGGFHISVQSLMLISQYNLPIKVIVVNNNALGMITQFQSLYFGGRLSGTTGGGGYVVPNIKDISAAYGLKYYLINEADLTNVSLLNEIFSSRNCIIEFKTEGLTSVSPKLEYNKPIEKPIPLLPEEEHVANMLIDEKK